MPLPLTSSSNGLVKQGWSAHIRWRLGDVAWEARWGVGLKCMTEQRQRGVQSILKVLSKKGQSFHSMATALQMPTS